ncbi:MAG TPA: GxxExxY protein [Candidatus Desulfobacillus sp.]|nr:GxxExxY protein [Candidatus Desulfobacillus sp.]
MNRLQREGRKDAKDAKMDENALSHRVIGAAIEVHRVLGPGLLESVYERALERELVLQGLEVRRQHPVSLEYKGIALGDALRLDMLVNDLLLLEIKAVEKLLPLHEAQLLTYLRLTGRRLGLLVNFNTITLKDGIKRVVNGL